jgi:hypothetical protein
MNGAAMHRFLLQFITLEGISNVRPNMVNDFITLGLNGRNPERQAKLAHVLLDGLIEPAIAGQLLDVYRYGRRESLLRPSLPRSVFTFLRHEIGGAGDLPHKGAVRRLMQQCVQLRFGNPALQG